MLTLRLLRVLVRCEPLAEGLCRWGLQGCLEGLLGAEGFGLPGVTAGVPPARAAASRGSPFGAVRNEAMELLSHLWAATGGLVEGQWGSNVEKEREKGWVQGRLRPAVAC